MPQNYAQCIPPFDSVGPIIAQQYIDKMNNFSDLEEVDDDDVKMRLFKQSLEGEVREWFRAFPVGSIADLQQFHRIFISRWEVKKNPL